MLVTFFSSFLNTVPPRVELNTKMQKGFKIKAGTTIILEADVFGKPMPRVTWKRNDDNLKSGEGQLITQQRHHFQLEIPNVTKEHTGTYTVLAENASGSKTAEIQVNVLGEILVGTELKIILLVFSFTLTVNLFLHRRAWPSCQCQI